MLVEGELFDDEVEVIHKCILNALPDFAVQIGWDVVGLIRSFDFLDPQVQPIEFLVDQILEFITGAQYATHTAHQQREESQANELNYKYYIDIAITSKHIV